MTTIDGAEPHHVLDARQLVRIEAVHRGFLYQHLYAAGCLLRAAEAKLDAVVVESDEDVELVRGDARTYVQIKTRQRPLGMADIADAVARFERLRERHARDGAGAPAFAIVSNAAPSTDLLERSGRPDWPGDVTLLWPAGPAPADPALWMPPASVADALGACAALAAKVPLAALNPETLVWKLAGVVTLASSGSPPREDHRFVRVELPQLFEQLVIQMQDFPAPPTVYRAQVDEPALVTDDPVRLVSGFSGAGKTAWVAQAAMHAVDPIAYFDVGETPGPALASAFARELSGRMFGRTSGVLGEILLPGASGLDMLGALNSQLRQRGLVATIVVDNVHRLTPTDLKPIVERVPQVRFLLLGQPGAQMGELEALMGIKATTLGGWSEDTIAAAAADAGCRADFGDCDRLSRLTGGLPFYVVNALSVASAEYAGSVAALVAELEAQTNVAETAQAIILRRAFDALSADAQLTMAVLSLVDMPITAAEGRTLVSAAFEVTGVNGAGRLRALSRSGLMELFGNDRIKVHDAVRGLGREHLETDVDLALRARRSLRDVVIASIRRDWSIAKLALMVRIFGQLGETRLLVEFATDELFHEMGVWPEIEPFLVAAAIAPDVNPATRIWAYDGLVFNDLRDGETGRALERIDAMEALLDANQLGDDEWLAWAMKKVLALSGEQDVEGVRALLDAIELRLPENAIHRRIFRYNRAYAYFKLEAFREAAAESLQLVQEYYDLLGLDLKNVFAKNPNEIRPLLKQTPTQTDDLKHLADALDLNAMSLGKMGTASPFGRIHAMKFYELAHAPESYVRVGQDLVDEFCERHDFEGARELIEKSLLPNIQAMALMAYVVPVRSQYAVILAYCGNFPAADAEMRKLRPYEQGLGEKGRAELRNQRALIERLRRTGPPPQMQIPPFLAQLLAERQKRRPVQPVQKVGRNERCPCGSGRKYKLCHGR